MGGERITAYTTPSPDGQPGVVVDVEGMMVDLVTFVKALAINQVIAEQLAKEKFLAALNEVWDNVQVSVSDGAKRN